MSLWPARIQLSPPIVHGLNLALPTLDTPRLGRGQDRLAVCNTLGNPQAIFDAAERACSN